MKQIYPASITGKGFAAGGSVLDHHFGGSEPFTLGVEEEYMLLDPQTFDLVQHVDTVLSVGDGRGVRRAHRPRADAVGAGDLDAGLQDAGTSNASCGGCAPT